MPEKKYLLFLVVLLAFLKAPAQLCQGSLGDPIVNITFGSGPNPGAPLKSTANLQYISDDCPDDGHYTVRSNTNSCFGSSWHSLNTDHTGNANGYFMLINASIQKSEFYVDTVRGLCPTTTYEFAAWIMNIILPSACSGNTIPPNLTFTIETIAGVVLQTYTSGDISASSTPDWKQYGFFFTTPAAVSDVVLRIKNNSTGGCGNDIAIDDITFRPCGPKLIPIFAGETGVVKELCEGIAATVTMTSTVSAGYTAPTFQWQESTDNGITWADIPGAITTSYSKSLPATSAVGNYLYRLSVAEAGNSTIATCRIASSALTIRINPDPVASASANTPVCAGSQIVLSASGGNEYSWTGVNDYSEKGQSVTINNSKIVDAGKYYVEVTSAAGCKNTDSVIVDILAAPVATVSAGATICSGDSTFLTSSGGMSYIWSPATALSSATIADPVAKPLESTIYTVVVSNDVSCTDSASVAVTVIPPPTADAGADAVIVEGQTVQLQGTVTPENNSFRWSPGIFIDNIHSLQPAVSPIDNTTYVLTVQSNNGCGSASDSVSVHVFKKVIIPNAFSPNGDGINDTWIITALNAYSGYQLSVFNRYGQVVFFSENYSQPWNGVYNGKPLPVGTYYYVLDLKQQLPILKGYVVILR